MAKRIIRKLTERVKQNIKDKKGRVKKSNYTGEALTYLNRYNGAAKARKIKRDTTLHFGKTKVPKNSELYRLAEGMAKNKGISISKLPKYVIAALSDFSVKGKLYYAREVENLKDDIRKSSEVYLNDEKVEKKSALLKLVLFRNKAVAEGEIYPYLIFEIYYDTLGGIHIKLPVPAEYRGFKEPYEWQELLDTYNIKYTPNT